MESFIIMINVCLKILSLGILFASELELAINLS